MMQVKRAKLELTMPPACILGLAAESAAGILLPHQDVGEAGGSFYVWLDQHCSCRTEPKPEAQNLIRRQPTTLGPEP